ncbi:MAG: circadian clock protein KaiC [Candidatus Binatota bacterium]|jgi:circadian clock protein KaiC|nr:circadian clock protein KaiC [Candidatus Binatota bacterium]
MTKAGSIRRVATDTPHANSIVRVPTGVRYLDEILQGGLPKHCATVITGPPGSGKTVLAQQVCFQNASPESRVLYFNILSEPTARTLQFLSQFDFFDRERLHNGLDFVDLGAVVRINDLESIGPLIMQHIKNVEPALVVIDGFKVFDDLARSREKMRKFVYELTVNLMAWESTTLLLGEYAPIDYETNPLFSVVDGLIQVSQREESGEEQRVIQVIKMRGTDHSRDRHPFVITSSGIQIFAPKVTIRRKPGITPLPAVPTGIAMVDELLGGGIPSGASVLASGAAGTGKTVLLLEFIYRGAQAGEKGIFFSFEETEDRLRASARAFGWDLDGEIARGMVEMVFVPQTDILVEAQLEAIRERVEAAGARRIAIDSLSVLLYKISNPKISRDKVFQIASIVHNASAVALLATDVPYGSNQISRMGVEETVVDGVIVLSSSEEGLERQRYIEIYKLRNALHLRGRHNMVIGPSGISVFPRYTPESRTEKPPVPVELGRRLMSGVAGLDPLLGGGLLERSVTLVSGSAGAGKSTFGLHFVAEGANHGEPGLFVSLEEGPGQLLAQAGALALPLQAAVDAGLIDIVYLSRSSVRAAQFLTILGDAVRKKGVRRLVLDGVSQMVAHGLGAEELRGLLSSLVVSLKVLGVTSVFTLESKSLFSMDVITDLDLSGMSDNLIVLRYARGREQLVPTLTIVKARSSIHDRGTHLLDMARGMHIGERQEETPP